TVLHISSVHFWTQMLSVSSHFTLQLFAAIVSLHAPENPRPPISNTAPKKKLRLVISHLLVRKLRTQGRCHPVTGGDRRPIGPPSSGGGFDGGCVSVTRKEGGRYEVGFKGDSADVPRTPCGGGRLPLRLR